MAPVGPSGGLRGNWASIGIGAATILAQARDSWRGTRVAVFQPAEEMGEDAQAMINDHLFSHFPKPDVILGQHVMSMPAGVLACRSGVITSAGGSFAIRMFGGGAHGSRPEASIDPVVMAASTVLRLQTIVSRENAAPESAVLTIGALQAGTKEKRDPGRVTVAVGHVLQISPIATTITGGLLCFALRYMAIRHGWHLPTARPPRGQPKKASVQDKTGGPP